MDRNLYVKAAFAFLHAAELAANEQKQRRFVTIPLKMANHCKYTAKNLNEWRPLHENQWAKAMRQKSVYKTHQCPLP